MRKYILSLMILGACTGVSAAAEEGIASFYHYNRMSGLTAAHRTLPFGSHVRVTNLDNGRTAVVTIMDRGPFIRGRIIDVSVAAADVLGLRKAGLAHVRVEKL